MSSPIWPIHPARRATDRYPPLSEPRSLVQERQGPGRSLRKKRTFMAAIHILRRLSRSHPLLGALVVLAVMAVPGLALGALSRSNSTPSSVVTCLGLKATIVGTSGNDFIRGTAGNDVIAGLGGDD